MGYAQSCLMPHMGAYVRRDCSSPTSSCALYAPSFVLGLSVPRVRRLRAAMVEAQRSSVRAGRSERHKL